MRYGQVRKIGKKIYTRYCAYIIAIFFHNYLINLSTFVPLITRRVGSRALSFWHYRVKRPCDDFHCIPQNTKRNDQCFNYNLMWQLTHNFYHTKTCILKVCGFSALDSSNF